MAFMITGGILIRSLSLCPEWFIAFFYTGLGTSLFLAGLTFFYQSFTCAPQFKIQSKKEMHIK